MANRERDFGRSYPSGSAKRKAKEEKLKKEKVAVSKIPKLTTFFKIQPSDNGTSEPQDDHSHPSTAGDESVIELETEVNKSTMYDDDYSFKADNLEETEAVVHSRAEEQNIEKNYSTPLAKDLENKDSFSTDLGKWPPRFDEVLKEYWIAKGSQDCQNKDSKFTSSKRHYKSENKTRFCQKSYFNRVHKLTNCKQERSWLCYSPSQGCLFCFPCKVMSPEFPSKFTEEGFDDWKNANTGLIRHEESAVHKKAMVTLLARKKKGERIDDVLVKQMENEQQYWRKVLARVVEVVKFLAERGLPFRGSDETVGSSKNGNYLGLLELLAKFDPFLSEHINAHGNKGKGHTSYLSKDVCEEFISLIGDKMLDQLISEIKSSKYYSVSLDSTPDLAHIDQLTLIVRYVLPSGPVERFVKFLEMEGHSSANLADSLLDFFKEKDINIKDCRGQSYDNASNMSGKYNGLQAIIKEKCKFAEYIPCFAHSLNLVGKFAAECCPEAVIFFAFVENIYTFFSASTHRWGLLARAQLNSESPFPLPKRMSDTRWSARADAISALHKGYSVILNVLEDIAEDSDAKPECRQQAKGLIVTMKTLETGLMTILWDQILERFQKTSVSLQSSDQDLNSACALYESLQGYVEALRSTFTTFEDQAKILTDCNHYRKEISRQRRRNRKYDYYDGPTSDDTCIELESIQPSESFRIGVFLVIVDSLVAALSKRQKAYKKLKDTFGFLRKLPKLSPEEVRSGATKLIQAYPEDLEKEFEEELIQFSELLKTDLAETVAGSQHDLYELTLYRLILDHSFGSCFPNVEIALKIYLTLMVTNCSGERSFSKLKRIKNEARASMGQTRLNHLSLMSIEHELLREIDTSRIIEEFSVAKSRKRIGLHRDT